MAESIPRIPKILIIVSGDFGELANALTFARGSELEIKLLLPKKLFAPNETELSLPAEEYSVFDDTAKCWLTEVEKFQPDLVLLFSAYLYSINRILSNDDLRMFLEQLRTRNIRIATTDPFLGLVARVDGSTFSDNHPGRHGLARHFSIVAEIVRDLPHIYLSPPPLSAPGKCFSFFNPRIVRSMDELEGQSQQLAGDLPIDPERRRWLFVLAQEDYSLQTAKFGIDRFHDLIARRLTDVVRCGRQPVIVAPKICLDSLITRDRPVAGLIPVSHGSHGRFTALQLDAEYVFYWNIFSNSIILRIANSLPIFFFDLGHLAHAIPAMLELGITSYYPNCELPALDQESSLAEGPLAVIANAQTETLQGARDHFAHSPTPEQLVQALLR